jgi:tyrosine decarboxylase / aspartate 1-decarboxylase
VWKLKAESAAEASRLAQSIFMACATQNLHLALVQLPESWFQPGHIAEARNSGEKVTCLRSVLMKPEHEAWLERIWEILAAASVK